MKSPVSAATNITKALAELQALKRIVVAGAASATEISLPGVLSTAFLFSVIGIDGDAAANSVMDFTANAQINFEVVAITGVTLTAGQPVSILAVGHGFQSGDYAQIDGAIGTVELNGNGYIVDVIDVDNITLRGTNGSSFTAWSSGGTVYTQRASLSLDVDTTAYMLLVDAYNEPIEGPQVVL